jgi:MFS family permease
MRTRPDRKRFYGWTVVRAAFVLAALGWGLGFYAPPVFLGVIRESTGWPLGVVSAAVTAHFLVGALVAANLPAAHHRLGAARTTVGAAALAAGLAGWAAACAPWQLFGAALLSGIGWGALGASALNAFVSPWFHRGRPAALGFAYNGASVGGIVLPPLWVVAIGSLGLLPAAVIIGGVALLLVHGWAQGFYAFAPALFGLVREAASGDPQLAWLPASAVFACAVLLQLLAIASFLRGRTRSAHRPGWKPNTRSKRST